MIIKNKTSLNWVNALKGLAILLVLLIHTNADSKLTGIFARIGDCGKYGVTLFFLISAFLLYRSLSFYFEEKIYNFKNGISWFKYKIIRFIPLFYIAVIICSCWHGNHYWLGGEKTITLKNILTHLSFIHGFFPLYCNSILGVEWFIGTLIVFILLSVILFKLNNSVTKSILFFIMSIFISYVFNNYLLSLKPFDYHFDMYIFKNYVNTFSFLPHLPTFFLGILLYYIFLEIKKVSFKNPVLLSYSLVVISLILIYGNLYHLNFIFLINKHTMWAIAFAFLIISQMIHSNMIICNKFFQIIGVYTWPIYLFHFLFIDIYKNYYTIKTGIPVLDWLTLFMSVLFVSFVVSILLVEGIEKPLKYFIQKHLKQNK